MICKLIFLMHTAKWANSYISNSSIQHKSTKSDASKNCFVSLTVQLNISHDQTVLFQAIQFSRSPLFAYSLNIKQFYLTKRGPESNGNEGVLCIPQSSSITEASPTDCSVSYPGLSLGDVLPLCRNTVGVYYGPNQLGHGLTE